MEENIKNKLYELGYKIDFWYEKGRLDAICIVKKEGDNLVLQKTYKEEDIAKLILEDFIK